uniref:Xaa-Pro dipeptidase n=1 Tax=Kwoniella pini CBS 10737 TaxID=1296096 RepID=A0A1B9HXX6_9TREE|nr:xaa-Pro dipeptidase [Kwoniella pini CBS 10737]OCF48122.1 xaa-Pro dipeptidase [Kwoniella pini CBS 10737]
MSVKYPARAHALKVIDELSKLISPDVRAKTHGIFLQASPTLYRDDTDRELPFHQEANFNYLTGVIQPSCSVAILFAFESDNSRPKISHNLFIPPEDPAETMWSVPPPSLDLAENLFESDKIQHTTSLPDFLRSAVKDAVGSELILHTLPHTMDYPALPTLLSGTTGVTIDTDHLFAALHIARLTKDETEIDRIREANRISSGAHETVMRELGKFALRREKGGIVGKTRSGKETLDEWEIECEGDAEAVFVAACRRSGATTQAYLPIVASGSRASTLHYLARGCCGTFAPTHSHETLPTVFHSKSFSPQVLLIDAGCDWQGYASDITRTIPVGNGGRFTKEAGEIYDLVLKMQKECEQLLKPGVHWDTLHLHAHKVLIDGFLDLGIFTGKAEAILQSGITAGLFPHGLGHSLGLDVHDSRQHLKSVHHNIPETSKRTPSKLYAYLRIRRPLLKGMVLTVEPGCYFAPQLMEEHGVWQSEFVNKAVLNKYLNVGGIRIEDVMVVTENGCENLTTVGRERQWIESICSGEA